MDSSSTPARPSAEQESRGRPRAGTGNSRPSAEGRPALLTRTSTWRNLTTSNGLKGILDAEIPSGMWSATAQKTGSAPTLPDIRNGHYITDQDERARRMEPLGGIAEDRPVTEKAPRVSEGKDVAMDEEEAARLDRIPTAQSLSEKPGNLTTRTTTMPYAPGSNELRITKSGTYPNGYKFPPKHTWQQSTKIGFWALIHFTLTPLGFLMVLYGLNVVGWGAMIFFLLIGAATPEMCFVQRPYGSGHYVKDCNDLQAPRRIWIEIDSQVLTALFCVTAFGLVPWRFRDFYYLLKWRIFRQQRALRRLAGWHSKWIRLPGWDKQHALVNDDPEALPEPPERAAEPPLTGVRASPTHLWKLDFFIWMQVLNTAFQVVLCVFMWGQNRYDRPSWATGTFVAFGCVVAGIGGIVQFAEGKRIKQIEGVPVEVGEVVEKVESRISKT